MENLDPLKILYHIINIVILFVLLRFLLYKPVTKFLNKRRDMVNGELESAARAQDEAKAELEKAKETLSNAQGEGRSSADRIVADAKKEAESIIARAKTEACDIQKRAVEERDALLKKAEDELRRESVTLGVEIARAILGNELTDTQQLELINRYTEKL